jgi:cell division protein ZapA
MTSKKSSVKVSIVGEDFTVRSDDPPEHTMSAAAHVDRTIRSVSIGPGAADPRKAAILAALQITDELLKERAIRDEFAEQLKGLSAEVRRMLPPAKR